MCVTCLPIFYNHFYRSFPLEDYADNDGHNVDGIVCLVCTIPIIFRYMSESRSVRNQRIKDTIHSTRLTRNLDKYTEIYSDLLIAIFTGKLNIMVIY